MASHAETSAPRFPREPEPRSYSLQKQESLGKKELPPVKGAGHLWLTASPQAEQGTHGCFQNLQGEKGGYTSPPSWICTSPVQATSLEAQAPPCRAGVPMAPTPCSALPDTAVGSPCNGPDVQLCRSTGQGWAPATSPAEAVKGRRRWLFTRFLCWRCHFVINSQGAPFSKSCSPNSQRQGFPPQPSATWVITDIAGTSGAVSTGSSILGDCSTVLQNRGQANALGRKSGQSARTFACPGGKSSPRCCGSLLAKPCRGWEGGQERLPEARHCCKWHLTGAVHERGMQRQLPQQPAMHTECQENTGCSHGCKSWCYTKGSKELLSATTDSKLPPALAQSLPWIFSLNYFFK